MIIDLLTRFIAAALAIEMLVALLFVHLPKGCAAVLDALEQALHDRQPVHRSGLVHHSDRGGQGGQPVDATPFASNLTTYDQYAY